MKTVGLFLALLLVNSRAFEIVLVNEADVPILAQVQSLDSDEVPDMEGYLSAGNERVYDNGNEWLSTSSMDVQEGDTRKMSVVANGNEVSACGDITFKRGTVVAYKPDGTCMTSIMHTFDSTKEFSFRIFEPEYAWIVANFNTGVDEGDRYYAKGPQEYVNNNHHSERSTITFQVTPHNSESGMLYEAYAKIGRGNQLHWYEMNNAKKSEVTTNSRFHAETYNPILNPELPSGRYSGVVKLRGEKWENAGDVEYFYLNLEIDKP